MKPTIIFYHSGTLDGKAAAYAAWRKFGDSAEYVGVDYANLVEKITETKWTGRTVYILGLSIPVTVCLAHAKPEKIVVCDHKLCSDHEVYARPETEILQCAERSTCAIFWGHAFPDFALPVTFRHIEDQELARGQYPNSYYVCLGLSVQVNFDDFRTFLDRVYRLRSDYDEIAQLQADGLSYKTFLDNLTENYTSRVYRFQLDGVEVPVLNVPKPFINTCLASLVKQSGIAMSYTDYGNKRMWSIRSYPGSGITAASLAKAFGGHGNDTVGGFSTSFTVTPDDLSFFSDSLQL